MLVFVLNWQTWFRSYNKKDNDDDDEEEDGAKTTKSIFHRIFRFGSDSSMTWPDEDDGDDDNHGKHEDQLGAKEDRVDGAEVQEPVWQ